MKNEFLENAISYLQQELGQGKMKFSPAQKEKIISLIGNESKIALGDAFNYLILNNNGLPTPQKLIDAVRIEASKHRDSSWQKEKKEYQQPLVADSELAKGALKIIKQFYPDNDYEGNDQTVNYENILADAQSMAIRFPGSDWPNIYHDWQAQWKAEGKL